MLLLLHGVDVLQRLCCQGGALAHLAALQELTVHTEGDAEVNLRGLPPSLQRLTVNGDPQGSLRVGTEYGLPAGNVRTSHSSALYWSGASCSVRRLGVSNLCSSDPESVSLSLSNHYQPSCIMTVQRRFRFLHTISGCHAHQISISLTQCLQMVRRRLTSEIW